MGEFYESSVKDDDIEEECGRKNDRRDNEIWDIKDAGS